MALPPSHTGLLLLRMRLAEAVDHVETCAAALNKGLIPARLPAEPSPVVDRATHEATVAAAVPKPKREPMPLSGGGPIARAERYRDAARATVTILRCARTLMIAKQGHVGRFCAPSLDLHRRNAGDGPGLLLAPVIMRHSNASERAASIPRPGRGLRPSGTATFTSRRAD
jgi:hypothetical protein